MMKLEDIPQAGFLILSVYFEGYKGTYANDSRRKLKDQIPKLGEREDIDIKLTPIQFSLTRTIADGVSRATGAQYQYGFSKMTPEKFRRLHEEIRKLKFKWWGNFRTIMGKLEDIPQTGILILSVYFGGYKSEHSDDSRKDLEDQIPKLGEREDIDIKLTPIQFSLIRTIADGVSRATGAQYQYGFSKMTPEKFRKLYEEIMKIKFKWLENFEIIIGNNIEGFE